VEENPGNKKDNPDNKTKETDNINHSKLPDPFSSEFSKI